MILDLPLDIIENIIISNQYVLTNYNTILNLLKTTSTPSSSSSSPVSRKRKRLYNDIDNENENHNDIYKPITNYSNVYHFLTTKNIINNIYKHSGWYYYFIENKNFIHHQKQFNDIVNNFNLLKPLFNNCIYNVDTYKENTKNEIIEIIDKKIDIKQLKLLINKIVAWWNMDTINTIDTFILFIIILSSGPMFNTTLINNYLSIQFGKEKEKEKSIDIDTQSYSIPCYFQPKYKFIPLFQKNIGMGYSFNIGWDLQIEQCIGFLYGGSSAEDYYFFDTSLKTYLNKNKLERLDYIKKNEKIINKKQLVELLLIDDKPINMYENYCINYM
jgi:hypothetical protein